MFSFFQILRLLLRAQAISSLLLAVVCHTTFATAPEFDTHNVGNCWIFNHLEKSGGMTIRQIMTPTSGGKGSGPTLYYSKEWKQGDKFTSNILPLLGGKVKYLAGGYVEALRGFPTIVDKCKFFTMFRHPVARMISAYYFCKYRSSDPLCGTPAVDARKVDIVTWAKHWGNYALRQFSIDLIPVDDVLDYINRIAYVDGVLNGVNIKKCTRLGPPESLPAVPWPTPGSTKRGA